ncbi:hypothetical protein [uncultured Rothia sp.]|uniref:hypothetical protein n=1 Tax=uncultured Rothia sp. TaxID=316088 RepID=UPI003217ECC9
MSSVAIEEHKVSTEEPRTSRRPKTGGRSGTIAKMLFSNRWATTSLAVFLPLIVGAGLTIAGLIAAALHSDARIENYSNFFTENIFHQVVLSIAFATTAFMTVSKNLTLMLGMGFTRKSFWRGFARASARMALLTTGLYGIFAIIEWLTTGYFIGWQVMAPSFDAIYMVDDAPEVIVLEFLRYLLIWFILLLVVQLLSAALALFNRRFGMLVTGLISIAFLLILLYISRTLFGTIYYDLGLRNLFFPYYSMTNIDTNEVQVFLNKSMHETLEEVREFQQQSQSFDPGGGTPFPSPSLIWLYTGQYALYCLGGLVFSYALGALLLKKTDLR